MNVISAVLVVILTSYAAWFFWGAIVQFYASPDGAPTTLSKAYWLLLLAILLEAYDLKYGLALPAVTGFLAIFAVGYVLSKRLMKLNVTRPVQVVLSCALAVWICAHVFGVLGVLAGTVLGAMAVLVPAPWKRFAAEMWDEPWWSVQAHRQRRAK
ncbi:hypothetical protein HPY42_03960 [Coprothermobacteraceae bacterium]|nr:hypothetical protein [Coprothermobacteraceae bacterium]